MKGLTLAAAALGLGVLLGLAPARPAIEVRDADDGGRLLQTLPVDASGGFRLVFTHSMYGGTVSESYRVLGGELERSEVRTENGGAAEYYGSMGNYHQDGAGWVVDAGTLTLPNLFLSVTSTGRQAIITARGRLELQDVIPDGHMAELVPA